MIRQQQKLLVVRALELAALCESNKLIQRALKREGYTLGEIRLHFIGKSFRAQLKAQRSA